MNSSTILWVDPKVLREITQRQYDDRESYRAEKERLLNEDRVDENEKFPEFDPDDLESIYFSLQEVNSESPPEALEEAQTEALSEALPEAHSEAIPDAWAEAQTEAHAEAKSENT